LWGHDSRGEKGEKKKVRLLTLTRLLASERQRFTAPIFGGERERKKKESEHHLYEEGKKEKRVSSALKGENKKGLLGAPKFEKRSNPPPLYTSPYPSEKKTGKKQNYRANPRQTRREGKKEPFNAVFLPQGKDRRDIPERCLQGGREGNRTHALGGETHFCTSRKEGEKAIQHGPSHTKKKKYRGEAQESVSGKRKEQTPSKKRGKGYPWRGDRRREITSPMRNRKGGEGVVQR